MARSKSPLLYSLVFAFAFCAALLASADRIAGLVLKTVFAAICSIGESLPAPFALTAVRMYAVNTIDAGLKREVILDTFLEQLVAELLPLNAFATDFSDSLVDEGDKVKVGYIPAASAARTFNGTYTIQASDYQKKEVVVDQHEYVSWGLSDVDIAASSLVNLQNQTRQKASSLAQSVLANILSVVTAGNYGAPVFTGGSAGFDLDDVADLRTAAVKAKWPKGSRKLILAADYYGNVVKGNTFTDAGAAGGTGTRETGMLPRLYTFEPYESESIPANGENLVGFMNIPSALAVAMRYLKPRRPDAYLEARAVKHAETGITFGFRQDYDTKTGVEAYIFECNFGKAVLEAEALKRLVSAL